MTREISAGMRDDPVRQFSAIVLPFAYRQEKRLSGHAEDHSDRSMEVSEMRKYCRRIGDHGEEFAARMLEDSGFRVIHRNYRSRTGEIDIIALKDGVMHFVEVKTRTDDEYGYPSDSVTESKRSSIRRTAECYLSERHAVWREISFDVMEISVNLIENCM